MNEREYEKLRRQIEDEYQHKMRALATVWALSNPGSPKPPRLPTQKIPPEDGGRLSKGKVASDVKTAVGRMPAEFTSTQIANAMSGSTPVSRSSIAHALLRMVKEGDLDLIEKGEGKRPSKFRRKSQDDQSSGDDTVEQCSPETRDRIRELAQKSGMASADFRERFLTPRGAAKIIELSAEDAEWVAATLEAEIESEVESA